MSKKKKARVFHPWLVGLSPGGHRKALEVPNIVSAINIVSAVEQGDGVGRHTQVATDRLESPSSVPSRLRMSLEPELAHAATSHCKGGWIRGCHERVEPIMIHCLGMLPREQAQASFSKRKEEGKVSSRRGLPQPFFCFVFSVYHF